MRNKNITLKSYIKNYPVAAFSAVCSTVEFVSMFLFIERTNTATDVIFLITLFITEVLHERMMDDKEKESNGWN